MLWHNGGMQITSRLDYAARPDQVYAMMTSTKWLEQLAQRCRANTYSTSAEPRTDGGMTTRLSMQLPAPSSVPMFSGKLMDVTYTVTWSPNGDESYRGKMRIDVAKVPLHFTGQADITAAGRGTVVDYDATLQVKIPVIGKKIEQAASPFMTRVIEVQQELGETWLTNAQ